MSKTIREEIKEIIKINVDYISNKDGISYEDSQRFPEALTYQLVKMIEDEIQEIRKAEVNNMRIALIKAKTFIEYARYELEEGKAGIGSQFPHKEDADIEIKRIEQALSQGKEGIDDIE